MTRTYTPWFLLAVALALAAIYLFPLYWMYVTSLKTGSEIFANPPTFWPNSPNPGVYPEVWARRTMPTFLMNSVLIAGGVTAITVILGTGCAYVLARYRNVWIDIGLFCVLMLQVLPASVMVTPLFVGFNQIGHNAQQMLSLSNPTIDWVKLADSMGVESARAESTPILDDLVRTGIGRRGPFLIEAVL